MSERESLRYYLGAIHNAGSRAASAHGLCIATLRERGRELYQELSTTGVLGRRPRTDSASPHCGLLLLTCWLGRRRGVIMMLMFVDVMFRKLFASEEEEGEEKEEE